MAMDLRQGIVDTARTLGMDPLDLATIISYETGGTFNPTQAGPTTKYGQHRGLIQFGEPQARQYGVDWADPLGSQLGPSGAIVRYFQGSGYKPGMGLLDAYSIVNAGGPGRYNASDTAAGGAPGTVRDKVEKQMGGHRQKAEALLGGGYKPGEASPYSVKVRHPPIPTVGTGGAKLGEQKSPKTAKQQFGDKIGDALSKGLEGMGGGAGGEAWQPNIPQLPQQAPVQIPSVATAISPFEGQGRDQLAMLMQRLNSGRIW